MRSPTGVKSSSVDEPMPRFWDFAVPLARSLCVARNGLSLDKLPGTGTFKPWQVLRAV